MINAFICLLFVLVSCTQFVHCDYTAEIRIFSYGNPRKIHRSIGAGGALTYCCCDCSGQPTCCSSSASQNCAHNCNTRVLICIADKYCVTSTYIAEGNQTFTNTAFGSLANPIYINVPGTLPLQVKQLFQFFVHRSGDNILIKEFTENAPVPLGDTLELYNQENYVSLHHSIAYRCSNDYYGTTCSLYCKAYNDSTNGHYTCNSAGGKICLPGYTNTSNNCLERIIVCREGCHPTRGYCTVSNECLCNSGWRGTNCDISTTCSSCTINGVCYEPNVCTCNQGWIGSDCSIPLCDPPCNGPGGRCYSPNNCSCYENWSGRLCDIPPGDGSGTGTCSNATLLLSILDTVNSINEATTCSKDNATALLSTVLSAVKDSGSDTCSTGNTNNATLLRRILNTVNSISKDSKDNATTLLNAVNSVSEANTADDDDDGSANIAMYVSIINVIINIIIVLLLIGICALYFTRKTRQYDLKGSELTKI